ncbi:MAG: hypothetical protein K9I99_15115, partial [Melioribacteraceae bacterium]|nr:hypothetical protein [Melioribacteraceae bacterium]
MENLGVNQQSNSVDNLFIPGFPVITKAVTIKSGAGVIAKNTVLGKETLGAVTVAADGGNTGNGVFTLDATTPKLARAKAGIYKVVCIAAATNGGTFRVTDPEGYVLGDVAVAATFSNQIKFSIADGATDFVVGDTFDVTIAAGSGKHLAYSSSNVDGTQYPEAILAA